MVAEHSPLRVGIAGHIHLAPGSERPIADALRVELDRISDRPVHGVTCLAAGTDQIFARVVLATGGTYEVILPALDYRDTIVEPSRADFDELLARATRVIHTGYRHSDTAAYLAANRELLSRADRLVAVWDGIPGCHAASTDRTVDEARQRGIPTTVLWPAEARRADRRP
ncbi:hypothetical protein E0H26_02195 [Micromonospora zingiberis]|uniref:DUF1273 family protein n=1 Tax=Micromonospora zingiberis TaxID=2053011 RepID=A0A4V2LXI4_9ACTN|nr:hypothetical protein [Micromonospora zingiberis]TCC00516.1 hypothetical protein E0H26_02195 [Micromonospora zingiberis]